ncbi:MAG: lysophospholipid acyltransferase family protein [Myxococcota bacterium]
MSPRFGSALLAVLAGLASVALRLIGATWRVEVVGRDPRAISAGCADPAPARGRSADRAIEAGPADGPHLAALLHQAFVVAAWLFRDAGYAVAISRSRDGDRVAAVLDRLGYAEPARGSSSRGGSAALIGLLRRLAAGTTVAVLVDGPRGPAAVAKPGIAALARRSATPIQPVALAARPALRLASWDRTLVPLPFARVVCAFGAPLDPGADDDEALARRVEQRLVELQAQAEARLVRGGS